MLILVIDVCNYENQSHGGRNETSTESQTAFYLTRTLPIYQSQEKNRVKVLTRPIAAHDSGHVTHPLQVLEVQTSVNMHSKSSELSNRP